MASLPYNKKKKFKLASLDNLKKKNNPEDDKEKSFFRETFRSKAHKFPEIEHVMFFKIVRNWILKRT